LVVVPLWHAFGPSALDAAAVQVWSIILYSYNYIESSPWAAALSLAPLGALATTAPGDEDSNYGYGDEHQQGEGAAEEEPYAPY
jgi:hypothetical protein